MMKFKMTHSSISVVDLDKSLAFYEEALGLKEVRRITAEDGSYILAFIANEESEQRLELTWVRDHKEPYNLGENESHIGFVTADFDGAHEKHKKMGCICFENTKMGLYFISDPDGYWMEIVPVR